MNEVRIIRISYGIAFAAVIFLVGFVVMLNLVDPVGALLVRAWDFTAWVWGKLEW